MKKFTEAELAEIIKSHNNWLSGLGGARADLRHANLRGSRLSGVNLSYANLRHADLSRSNLRGVNFSGADLEDAEFKHAISG